MSTDEDDDEFEDVELPTTLTCRRLDTSQQRATAAGQQFTTVERDPAELHTTLLPYERALRESEPYSTRAHHARIEIGHTLAALEPVFHGLDRARWP